MRKLSKSKLIAFQQCPKRLWLSIYHPERAQISETTQAQFNIGYAVGDLAHTIFDPQQKGRIFNVMQEGVVPILEQTQTLLQGHQPIFEAGIATDAALAFVDVLLPVRKKSGTKWKMIEVKSSTSEKMYRHLLSVAAVGSVENIFENDAVLLAKLVTALENAGDCEAEDRVAYIFRKYVGEYMKTMFDLAGKMVEYGER